MFDSKSTNPVPDSRPIFTVRIVYKCGYVHDFKVYSFTVNNNTYEWESVEQDNKPVILGIDEIAAVWLIGIQNV